MTQLPSWIRQVLCLVGLAGLGATQAATYTVPANTYFLDVVVSGAGGGGGGFDASSVGGAGGSGAVITARIAVTPGQTVTYFTGTGGVGGVSPGSYSACPNNSGGAGGTAASAGNGGKGGDESCSSGWSGGGGGGGSSSVLMVGTTVLQAGGGGGGGGGSNGRAPTAATAGTAGGSSITSSSTCATAVNGSTGLSATGVDGGGGGGGGGGYSAGSGGTAGKDGSLNATGGGAGGSCSFAGSATLINLTIGTTGAAGGTGSTNATSGGNAGTGSSGSVTITPTPTLVLIKQWSGLASTDTSDTTLLQAVSGVNTLGTLAATSPTLTTGSLIALTSGTAVTVSETLGVGNTLLYSTNIACTDTNGTTTGNTVTLSASNLTTLTIPATSVKTVSNTPATYRCTFTNQRRPSVQLRKISQGGIGTFAFTLTGLSNTTDQVQTTTAGTVAASAQRNWGQIGTAATVTETPVTGYVTSSTCSDSNSAVTGNTTAITSSSNVTPLTTAAMVAGATWVCTVTNAPALTLTKSVNIATLRALNDPASTAAVLLSATPALPLVYTLTLTNTGTTTLTSTVFKDTLPSGLTLTAASMNGTVLTNIGTATQPQFNLGSLTGGAVRTITLTTSAAVARDTVQGPYLNAATVTPGTTPTTTSNTVRTDLVYPTLSKTVQNLSTGGSVGTSTTGLPGNVVEYCLNFANNGSLNLPSYVLNDTISSNTAVQRNAYDAVSGQTGSGVKVVQGGTTTYLASSSAFVTSNTLSVNLGTLNAGTSGQLCFQGKIQ